MKIDGPGATKSATSIKKRKDVSAAGDFGSLLVDSADTAATSSTESAQAVQPTGLDVMLSMQEVTEEEASRRKVMAYGNSALESLEQLRTSLLMGRLPEHVLRNLQNVVQQHKRQAIADPRLTDIINDIELRAAVELAKIEVARERNTSTG